MKTQLMFVVALQIASPAFACRLGGDQQLFEKSPPADALPGAQIIRVHFSNAGPAIRDWPRQVTNPLGEALPLTLIGVARRLDQDRGAKPFPVYAVVTSCSSFWSMHFGEVHAVTEGDYYLIGTFSPDPQGKRFFAGGRRTHGGKDLYGGFHF